MFNKITRQEATRIAIEKARTVHDRIGARLFGQMGASCLNLYSDDWRTRNVGVLGKIAGQMNDMNDEIEVLKEEVLALQAEAKAKPKPRRRPGTKTRKRAKK